jgi:hypothetical protein
MDRRKNIASKLKSNTYECLICCQMLRSPVSFWSCVQCWSLFHWKCIDRWSRSKTDSWTCPACQTNNSGDPVEKKCFCNFSKAFPSKKVGKSFSCREICPIVKKCGHSCTLECHPGPCDDCSLVVPVSCHCSKVKRKLLCSESKNSFACKSKCGKLLACGQHKCNRTCHSGECSPCAVQICPAKKCSCGKTSKAFICPEKPVKFSCSFPCNKLLDCRKHYCELVCHSRESACNSKCPKRSQTYCYCGKKQLSTEERNELLLNCETPRSCSFKCQKQMNCGHKCQQICHEGECSSDSCCEIVQKACKCGKTSQLTSCNAIVTCESKCNKWNACGKHTCSIRCCDKSQHLECLMICNKKLACGVHLCQLNCHPNEKCLPCSLVSFDELTCHCGNTRILPPVQCSQTLGECEGICRREENESKCKEHFARFPHKCHPEEECPRCHALVQVKCFCGQSQLSMECWQRKGGMVNSCGKTCPFELCSLPCHTGAHRFIELEPEEQIEREKITSQENAPFSVTIPRRIALFISKNSIFVMKIHKALCDFNNDHTQRALFLPPMNEDKRNFVCFICPLFAITSEEVDDKPVKSVIVWKCHGPNRPIPSLLTIKYELEEELGQESEELENNQEILSTIMSTIVLKFTEPHEDHAKYDEFASNNQALEANWKDEGQKLVLTFAKPLSNAQMKRLKKLISSTFGCFLDVLF